MVPRLAVSALALAAAVPHALAAQDTTAAFRRGQWGTELSVGAYGFSSLGVLRFSDARRAWVADVAGDLSWRAEEESENNSQYVTLRIGRRRHAVLQPSVYRLFTVGLLGSYDRSSGSAHTVDAWSTSRSLSGGAFAELGAQWMVNRHLSLGASWSLTWRYRQNRYRSVITLPDSTQLVRRGESSEVSISFRNAGVRGAFYF